MELTILMPCLNEAKTISASIQEAKLFLEKANIDGEILISDNGSNDGSVEIAMEAGARVIHAPIKGYGAALIAGIAQARGRYVVMGDCDMSYDFSALDDFLVALRAGSQLVMGNRFAGEILPGAMPALHRYFGNPVLSFIGRLFFRVKVKDFHCGLRGFERSEIEKLNLISQGMEFASEMVVKAALVDLKISEVPITLRPDGRDRPPHLRSWRDGWRHLRFLLLFCPRWLFLYPGIVLLMSGLIMEGLIQKGTVSFLGLGLGVHTMMYMAASCILGAQMIFMAIIIKWISILSGISPIPFWFKRWPRSLGLEAGLVLAFLLFVTGLIWSVNQLIFWQQQGFGGLDPALMMREVIPAVTLLIIGGQIGTSTMLAAALYSSWISAGRGVYFKNFNRQ